MHYYMLADALKRVIESVSVISSQNRKCCEQLKEMEKERMELEETRVIQLEGLENTIRLIEELNDKLKEAAENKKSLDLKLKNEKDIVENTIVIYTIAVDDEEKFKMVNGIVDLNRDIIMKLLKVINDPQKTRNIVGMAEIFYSWSKKPIFHWVQLSRVSGLAYPTANTRYDGAVCWGMPHGRGVLDYGDGRRYEGTIMKGKREGKGIMMWPDGTKYVGEFGNDDREGYGVETYADGNTYNGQWHAGKKHGRGTFTTHTGEKYTGEFANVREGRGVYKYAGGEVYDGEWKADQPSGKGTLSWPNGDKYLGEFSNSVRNGWGVMTDKEGRVTFTGQWKDDKHA